MHGPCDHDPRAGAVHRHASCHDKRAQRAALIARLGEGGYKGLYSLVSIVGVVLIALGLCALPRDRLDRRLVSARLDAACRGRAHPARDRLLRRAVFARPHQDHAQAPDAGRDQAVGARASDRQWRPRLDRPVRLAARLGGGRPHFAQAPHRPRHAADPGRRLQKDIIAVVAGTALYLALGFLFHPYVVGVPAFGR